MEGCRGCVNAQALLIFVVVVFVLEHFTSFSHELRLQEKFSEFT